jgi:hypothetical protein
MRSEIVSLTRAEFAPACPTRPFGRLAAWHRPPRSVSLAALLLVAGLGVCAITDVSAGPVAEFEGAYSGSYIFNYWDQYMWLWDTCYTLPCPFGPIPIRIKYQAGPFLSDDKVTKVEVRFSTSEAWGELPVPGLPAHEGTCQVASLSATVPCGGEEWRDVYVRVTDEFGVQSERRLAVQFKCYQLEVPGAPPYKIVPPEDEPPADPFEFTDPPQEYLPDYEFDNDENMYFWIIGSETPADSVVTVRLTQDLDWPVVAAQGPTLTIHAGDVARVGYRVDFPTGLGAPVTNRFRLTAISAADTTRRGTSSAVGVALPSQVAGPVTSPWLVALSAVALGLGGAWAIHRRQRADCSGGDGL